MELQPYTINEPHLRRVIRGDVDTTKRYASNIAYNPLFKTIHGTMHNASIGITGAKTKRVYVQWRDCSTGRWVNRKRLLCAVSSNATGYADAAEKIQHWLDSE